MGIRRGARACLLLLLVLCTAQPLLARTNRPETALVPVFESLPTFSDDLEFEHLTLAIRRNISYLKMLNPASSFTYGPQTFSTRQVIDSQEAFLALISQGLSPEEFNRRLQHNFRVYRATGRPDSRKVLFTGYYEPVFDASLTPDPDHRHPIYRTPGDLIRIDLSLFDEKYKGERIVARVHRNRVVPYYTRRQIEIEKVLAGRNLEIAWLRDPVDAYLLHIEGAGRLTLKDGGTLLVNYATSNGRPYRSFGRYLLDKGFLRPDQMTLPEIRRYLSANPEILHKVLDHNEAYIFFQQIDRGPLGNTSIPLTVGRSLALDTELFPRAALAFIRCTKPTVDDRGKITGWTAFSRFVLNQDTGAAIKGAGRADLFWGSGTYAETAAWQLKHDGDLYVLIKNP